jgi:hypothetical protein
MQNARRRIASLKYAILDGLLDHTRNLPVEDDLTVLAADPVNSKTATRLHRNL